MKRKKYSKRSKYYIDPKKRAAFEKFYAENSGLIWKQIHKFQNIYPAQFQDDIESWCLQWAWVAFNRINRKKGKFATYYYNSIGHKIYQNMRYYNADKRVPTGEHIPLEKCLNLAAPEPIDREISPSILRFLTPRQQKVIKLYYEDGLDDQAIGKLMGTSHQNVNHVRNYALKKLHNVGKDNLLS